MKRTGATSLPEGIYRPGRMLKMALRAKVEEKGNIVLETLRGAA
jgi:hypothetical protein